MSAAIDHLESTYRVEVVRRGSAPSLVMLHAIKALRDDEAARAVPTPKPKRKRKAAKRVGRRGAR